MRDYELTVLFHPDLEMNLDPALDKVKKLITANQGEILKEENDGKKRLSYTIDGQDFAVYYFIDVKLPAQAPAKIESVLNITDEVIRHMLVKADERKAKFAARHAVKHTEEEESSEEDGATTSTESPSNQEKGE